MSSPLPSHRSFQKPSSGKVADFYSIPKEKLKPQLHLVVPEGQIQVHSSPYRGSFSGVFSEALRTAGLGSFVMIAQFLKGGVDQGSSGVVHLCGRLEWIRPAVSCCLPEAEVCSENAQKAVADVWQTCKEKFLRGNLDKIVLDEIGLAINLGYLQEDDLISTLQKRREGMDVILTGPAIPSSVISMADQVTELRGF